MRKAAKTWKKHASKKINELVTKEKEKLSKQFEREKKQIYTQKILITNKYFFPDAKKNEEKQKAQKKYEKQQGEKIIYF